MNKVAGALKPVHTKESTDMCMVIGESTELCVEIFASGKIETLANTSSQQEDMFSLLTLNY